MARHGFQVLLVLFVFMVIGTQFTLSHASTEGSNSIAKTAKNVIPRSTSTLYDNVGYYWDEFLVAIGIGDTCPYISKALIADDTTGSTAAYNYNNIITGHVAYRLRRTIKGQQEAVSILINAINTWEQKRHTSVATTGNSGNSMNAGAGAQKALVLAMTGSTGIGKTETSIQLAASALWRRKLVGAGSSRYVPQGLLLLHGEDYSASSGLSIADMHKALRYVL